MFYEVLSYPSNDSVKLIRHSSSQLRSEVISNTGFFIGFPYMFYSARFEKSTIMCSVIPIPYEIVRSNSSVTYTYTDNITDTSTNPNKFYKDIETQNNSSNLHVYSKSIDSTVYHHYFGLGEFNSSIDSPSITVFLRLMPLGLHLQPNLNSAFSHAYISISDKIVGARIGADIFVDFRGDRKISMNFFITKDFDLVKLGNGLLP